MSDAPTATTELHRTALESKLELADLIFGGLHGELADLARGDGNNSLLDSATGTALENAEAIANVAVRWFSHLQGSARSNYLRWLPRMSNIVGFGYGLKFTANKIVPDTLALRVYVRTKKTLADAASSGEAIPAEVHFGSGMISTDVVPVGTIRPDGRPILCGVSGAHEDGALGTLGCLVQPRTPDGSVYFLSNNHVLANVNNANLHDVIVEPAPDIGGTPIANLSDFQEIHFDRTNKMDAAIAQVLVPPGTHAQPQISGIGAVQSPHVLSFASQAVRKCGSATDLTHGIVVGFSEDVPVLYGVKVAHFEHQIAIKGSPGAFTRSGDSGSLVVDSAGHPVGLHFASSEYDVTSFANPIQPILDRFNVNIM